MLVPGTVVVAPALVLLAIAHRSDPGSAGILPAWFLSEHAGKMPALPGMVFLLERVMHFARLRRVLTHEILTHQAGDPRRRGFPLATKREM